LRVYESCSGLTITSSHLLLWWCSYELSALLFQPSMLGCVACILLCTVTRPSYLPFRFLLTKDATLQSHLLTCYCGGVAMNWAHFYFNLQCSVALVVFFCALCTFNVRSRFSPFGHLFLLAYWRIMRALWAILSTAWEPCQPLYNKPKPACMAIQINNSRADKPSYACRLARHPSILTQSATASFVGLRSTQIGAAFLVCIQHYRSRKFASTVLRCFFFDIDGRHIKSYQTRC